MERYAIYEKFEEFGPQKVLADYALKLRYEDLPEDVVMQAKKLLLHIIGVSLSAYQTKIGKTYVDLAKEMGSGKGEATIIGDGSKVSVLQAAFANGSLADVMDWEDAQVYTGDGHGAAVVFPTALVMGEKVKASGKDILTAIVAAWEVMIRIEDASARGERFLTETFRWSGMPCSEFNSFGAAIVTGRLLNFNMDKMVTAIGIAGAYSHPIVNSSTLATRADAYHGLFGWTCLAGIFAALHAQKGITGYETLLEGPKGYWKSLGMDHCDFDLMTKGLGKTFYIMNTAIKRWPTEYGNQSYLDAVDDIVSKHDIKVKDIEAVNLSTALPYDLPPYYPEVKKPISMVDAQFSLPYCIALLLSGERVGANWYAEEKYTDPEIMELQRKVKVVGFPESLYDVAECWRLNKDKFSWMTASIEIVTKDGKRYSKTVRENKGHPKNPMSIDEIKEIFRLSASDTLEKQKIEKIIRMVDELEKIDDITELAELLY